MRYDDQPHNAPILTYSRSGSQGDQSLLLSTRCSSKYDSLDTATAGSAHSACSAIFPFELVLYQTRGRSRGGARTQRKPHLRRGFGAQAAAGCFSAAPVAAGALRVGPRERWRSDQPDGSGFRTASAGRSAVSQHIYESELSEMEHADYFCACSICSTLARSMSRR